MARALYTIWALLLTTLGLPVFQTCFANTIDDDCELPPSGPAAASFLFNSGVYTIILNSNLYPESFRKPKDIILAIYELRVILRQKFLVSAFILEFTAACIWASVDELFLSTLPKGISQMLSDFGLEEFPLRNGAQQIFMSLPICIVAVAFFLITLHVTDTIDFTIYRDRGAKHFIEHVRAKILEKIESFFPKSEAPVVKTESQESDEFCQCKPQRSRRSKIRTTRSR